MQQQGSFFVALPDQDLDEMTAARLGVAATVRLNHPSGRPWLFSRVPSDQVVDFSDGCQRVALVGSTTATTAELEREVRTVRSPEDLARVASRFPGSYCVVGSFAGVLYVHGPAMETRRIHHTEINGVRIISDRADVLAELSRATIDHEALALRLVRALPHPYHDVPLWSGVHPVPGGNYLIIQHDGRSMKEGAWWHAPAPIMSRTDGAERFREALKQAVDLRTAGAGLVACDLSGGLDSTPVCYFAAQSSGGVLARTMYNDDPGGREDLEWALRALESMPGLHTHIASSSDEMPDFYGGLDGMDVSLDEPTQAAIAAPRIQYMLSDDVARGITRHIHGIGGDHLLRGVKAWEHTLLLTQPRLAWRRARDQDVLDDIGPITTLRRLSDRRSYREWFRDVLDDALAGVKSNELPKINDWSTPFSFPSWMSGDARDAVAQRFRQTSSSLQPLDTTMAVHTDLVMIREAGRLVRGTNQLGQPVGVAYEAPFLDDHVVEAALAVRREERDTPLEWKPLMKTAMKGLLPDDYLRRTTKVGGGAQAVRGYGAHYVKLVEICEASGLFDSGLVNVDRFVDMTKPKNSSAPPDYLGETINVALFMRNLATKKPVVV